MRTASQLFFLAVFSLLSTPHARTASSDGSSKGAARPKDGSSNVCAFEPNAIVSDACASYSTLDDLNDYLHPYIHSVTTKTDFFSFYRLNLYNKKCPFWDDENGMCGNIACAVNTLANEEDIPLVWRAQELGKLEGPKAHHPGRQQQQERKADKPLAGELGADVGESCIVEYDDECDERDYCVPEDESASGKGDYVSLVDNPERFTGYAGVGAQQVWEAIYRENCFTKPQPAPEGAVSPPGLSPPFGLRGVRQFPAAQQLRNVLKEHNVQQGVQQAIAKGTATGRVDDLEFEDSCVEKRVFYKVVSGMHASISTHLCYEYLNQTTGQWGPNYECYLNRLHNYPERISNIYFNYALLLRAAGKVRSHIQNYEFCSADPWQDKVTKELVLILADAIPAGPEIFDETVMFQSPDALGLKEDFRNRFRNISRVMDCVGCDKCRLWGKVQTAGYGTALKILFEFDESDPRKDPPLRRHELVALMNTLDRVSHSLQAIHHFRQMFEERNPTALPSPPVESPSSATISGKIKVENTSAASEDTEDELDDEEDVPPFRRKPMDNRSVSEIFMEEFDLVWRTYVYVIKSWVAFPGKAWKILIIELNRLWSFWLGLPVRPRSWAFQVPPRDEI